jgi:hypothetical protein
MSSLPGFSPPTDGCDCDICRVLRSHSAEYELEHADTLPPSIVPAKNAPMSLDEIRAQLAGVCW